MAARKRTTKQRDTEKRVMEQVEDAFLAGLGALSNAQKAGEKTFDSLVKQGETFRKDTSRKTEALIDDVQDAIREMSDDAQSKAAGLLDQVRGKSKLKKLDSAFDSRIADAMDRLHVPSKNDVDKINRKLNKILKLLDEKPKAVRKAAPKKAAAKKARATTKPKSRKKTAKKTVRKTVAKAA